MAALTDPLAAVLGHPTSTWQLALIATAALTAITLGVLLVRRGTRALRGWKASAGVKGAALVALMATGVSMDTNWMFWGTHLHVDNPVLRAFLFADLEEALIVFAIQARENTLREDGNGKQGIQGVLVWVMSGLAMLPAWIEAGWMEGTVRALAGPGLAALLWHFALGLEFKVTRPKIERDRTLAKIARNLRERILARLGIVGPDQSALEIRQDRALDEVVRLTMRLGTFNPKMFREARRKRLSDRQKDAVRRSGAAEEWNRLQEILKRTWIIRNAAGLADLEMPSPWEAQLEVMLAEARERTRSAAQGAPKPKRETAPNAPTSAPGVPLPLPTGATATAPTTATEARPTVPTTPAPDHSRAQEIAPVQPGTPKPAPAPSGARVSTPTDRQRKIRRLILEHGRSNVDGAMVGKELGVHRSNGRLALKNFLEALDAGQISLDEDADESDRGLVTA